MEYTPPSIHTLCNLKPTIFHFGVELLYSTTDAQHDLPSLASPKGRWQVLSVGLVFSKVPHQALYVLVTLHLQSSTNRSLLYCTLQGVLWQMCHAWNTCGIVCGSVLMTDRLSYTRGEQQKFSTLHTSGSLMADYHAWNTHEIVSRAALVMDRPHYMWNYPSCATKSCSTDRHMQWMDMQPKHV